MANKASIFTIREQELSIVLEITRQELDKIIYFFDARSVERQDIGYLKIDTLLL
jgi:hypothetical protein